MNKNITYQGDFSKIDDLDKITGYSDLGNPSAAFDALSGLNYQKRLTSKSQDHSRVIAFYLPQYHRILENSQWWGPGFTEWTNVVKGQPNFDGHYQPHLPRELGFYDLSNIEVMREQSELAKLYGVEGFCFYYYWFSGRRILEKPIDNFLKSDIDINYCLCWANENWTRTWDGDVKNVLLEQKYLEKDPQEFIESLFPHFQDPRYIRVDGKPMLVVYRAKDIPNVSLVFSRWRESAEKAGFRGLHIAVVDFYDISRPEEVEADALIEFPPHKFNGPHTQPDQPPKIFNPKFEGGIVDYAKVIAQSLNRKKPDFTLYRGALPSWDNTARRQNTPTILYGSTPRLFKVWMDYIRAYTRITFKDRSDPFIFINAWNEWGEGCHLEPDQKWGLKYLDALKSSNWHDSGDIDLDSVRSRLFQSIYDELQLRPAASAAEAKSEITTLVNLKQISGTGSLVQKIAFALRNYPTAYNLGKRVYAIFSSIRKKRK